MNKILIATWIQYNNYGSLLQAYCLKKILENLIEKPNKENIKKIQVHLLNYSHNDSGVHKNLITRIQNNNLQSISLKLSDNILRKIFNKQLAKTEKAFEDFRSNMLDLYPVKYIHTKSELNNLKAFDLYVAGGDQIWNPKLLDDVYLLNWTPKNKTKISYAPSICVEHLSKKELAKYDALKDFNDLSVREYTAAAKQISNKIHKIIYEVTDPVILYGKNNIQKLCKKNKISNYIFVYLLGDSKQARNYSIKLAQDEELELKTLPFVGMRNLKNDLILLKYACWGIGPLEFVNLIYNSKILITDSFHGLVVALLLHKDFIILPREKGNTEQNNRLINLLEKTGLSEHFGEMPGDLKSLTPINWNEVDEKIEEIQKYSLSYLKKIIKID